MTFRRLDTIAGIGSALVAIAMCACAQTEPVAIPPSTPPPRQNRECTTPPAPPVVSADLPREPEYGFVDIELLDRSKAPRIEPRWMAEPRTIPASGSPVTSGADIWFLFYEKSGTLAKRFSGGVIQQTARLPKGSRVWASAGDGRGGLWVFDLRYAGEGALTSGNPIGLTHVPYAGRDEKPKLERVRLDWPGVELSRVAPAPDGGVFAGITIADSVDFGKGRKIGAPNERVDAVAMFDKEGSLAWVTPLPDLLPDRLESISASHDGTVYAQSVFRDGTGSRAVVTLDARGARASTRVIRLRDSTLLIAPHSFEGPRALDEGGWIAAGNLLNLDFGAGPLRGPAASSAAVVAFDAQGQPAWGRALDETVLQAKALGNDGVLLTQPDADHVRIQVIGAAGLLRWSAVLSVPERCLLAEQEWIMAPASDAIRVGLQCRTYVEGDWTRDGPVLVAFADVSPL